MNSEQKFPTRKTVNIINFVRGSEPRLSMDLYTPVVEENRLNKRYGFSNTFLLQYDALLREDFRAFFKREKDDKMELGVWFEMCRALTQRVGIPWRGRPGFDWDWYVDPGFLPAYTQEQRRALIDEVMRLFKEVFGAYPVVAGSWLLDAWSMEYMTKTYGIRAFAVCREQYAVDAYTLWGGYYNQGYYPSRKNMLCPAPGDKRPIAPTFRMLGIDPIYGYDPVRWPNRHTGCTTLEPVWDSGADADCVDWYFRTYFENEALNFAYAQLGQENSFGWDRICRGLPMQLEKLKKLADAGAVTVETLGDTGRWFSETFAHTPATALSALDDWDKNGLKSVWYDSQRYRANLFAEKERVFFRDIQLFDPRFEEAYYDSACREWQLTYENLPVMDGLRWNTEAERAAMEFAFELAALDVRRTGPEVLTAELTGKNGEKASVLFTPETLTISLPEGSGLHFRAGKEKGSIHFRDGALRFCHREFSYAVPLDGTAEPEETGFFLRPAAGQPEIVLHFTQ